MQVVFATSDGERTDTGGIVRQQRRKARCKWYWPSAITKGQVMDTTVDQSSFDIAIACSLSAAERMARGDEWGQLLAGAEDVIERADGYALRFPNSDAWVSRAVKLIVAERKCCPFFGFALTFDPDGGPIWLQISGPGEVKTYIREQVVPVHLRSRV
jgi:hypothetical protein